MKDYSKVGDKEFVFASIMLVANRMDTLLERTLSKYNITAKQWFLLLVLYNAFDSPPTIKELAMEMGSSHQNVKQVALKLHDKGMVVLEKDKRDMRATRVIATRKSYEFWSDCSADGKRFMDAFYNGIDLESLNNARYIIAKIMLNLNKMQEGEAL